jgi:putative DNA primase/helicase
MTDLTRDDLLVIEHPATEVCASRPTSSKKRATHATTATEAENASNNNVLGGAEAVANLLQQPATVATETGGLASGPFPPLEERPQWVVLDDWVEHEGRRYRPGTYWCTTTRQGRGENAVILPVNTWVCGPLHVEAQTADPRSDNVGRVLRFRTSLGTWRTWACPMELLRGSGDELRGALLSMGLLLDTDQRRLLAHYLLDSPPQRRVTCTEQTGWLGDTFVLPDEAIGPNASGVIFQNDGHAVAEYAAAGTLQGWRDGVAQLAVGNPLMTLALSAAFAGPLLKRVHAESGGLHFVGPSSVGKTTLLQAAASVWGGPEYRRTWRATANGLEGAAALFNDSLLALDEISECDPRDVGRIVYLLGNGAGKQRASRNGAARALQRWRCIVVSTGERSIATSMQEGGVRVKAGQQVRLLDIPAERQHGVFDVLHGFESARALADHLKTATATHYGHAGREFLRRLTDDKTDLGQALGEMRALPEFATPDGDGQAARAASRLALVALAGELATQYALTGWPEGAAIDAAAEALQLWLSQRGQGRTEDRQVVDAVRAFLERHGDSRFSDVEADDAAQRLVRDRAGWWRARDGKREWLFTSDGLREAVKGFDFKFACNVLERHGWLIERGKTIRIGGRTPRVHVIVEADHERV